MKGVEGQARTLKVLLGGTKYSIDYYQREFRWEAKQIKELVEDLTSKFLEFYDPDHERHEVREYGHYFLGSIIISKRGTYNFLIDGQQRLTSLSLLLIYLNNLQRSRSDRVPIDTLIFSEQYGRKSFNVHVDERTTCMEALHEGIPFDDTGQSESVRNILARYGDLEESFPEDLQDNALPYFIDWLIENVHLVEIVAYSDEDAYTIFETMNDRGLSLAPTEMLKGYLLSNISDNEKRIAVNTLWKQRVSELSDLGKDADADTFKAWLRSQYADTIRERKRGAKAEDFDLIGTEFHRWVRDNHEKLGLNGMASYFQFINRDFNFYSRQYLRLMRSCETLTPGLEHVFYNAQHGFTMQLHLLLAPLAPEDSETEMQEKIRLVAIYLDILLNRRMWNFKAIDYSTMQYAIFLVIKDIRRKQPPELADILAKKLDNDKDLTFSSSRLSLHGMNRKHIHRILARITGYIEQQSGMAPRYVEYISGSGANKYEVEHVWADKPERHTDEFAHAADFREYRNRIGDLLLLPKSFNASYGALTYEEKLPHYNSQNLLARTLNPNGYDHNPGFLKFKAESGLPFRHHPAFNKADLDERNDLYRKMAEQIWDPKQLLKEVKA